MLVSLGPKRKTFSFGVLQYDPKGPYAPHLRTLVPNLIPGMAFGTRVLKQVEHGVFVGVSSLHLDRKTLRYSQVVIYNPVVIIDMALLMTPVFS